MHAFDSSDRDRGALARSRAGLRKTLALSAALLLCGCASISTLDDAALVGTPKIYSGTRLDLHAIAGDSVALRRFPVAPPRFPLIDLPFSFALDTLVLPLTVPAACYEAVFH
ncbi:YceK/YidQ family lipoprotein [Ectothiorhodospiraceae bacterium WFHF3C12]|nr:YceK/YidQ family lipoprotein [Ectothiorhodospiraceae bacterium WFHF3C12]